LTQFSAKPDRRHIESDHRSIRYIAVTLTAPINSDKKERAPVRIAFVMDRSGSMFGDKLMLARQAVIQGIGHLNPEDEFTVVFYDDEVHTILPLCQASAENRTRAIARLDAVMAGGTTNLSGGWLEGCQQLATGLVEDNVARCLLLTDGLANRGIVNPTTLEEHAHELHLRSVSTSTFGVGEDFDEALLQGMAREGGGHFYFVESPTQIPDLLTSELGETLDISARDVALNLTLPEQVSVHPVSNFRCDKTPGGAKVLLGNLCSGQQLTIILEVSFQKGPAGHKELVSIAVGDRECVFSEHRNDIEWSHEAEATNFAQAYDIAVMKEVVSQRVARARQHALMLNRIGDYEAASERLSGTARRIRQVCHDAPWTVAIAESLLRDCKSYAHQMDGMSRKQLYYQQSSSLTSREITGRSRSILIPSEWSS